MQQERSQLAAPNHQIPRRQGQIAKPHLVQQQQEHGDLQDDPQVEVDLDPAHHGARRPGRDLAAGIHQHLYRARRKSVRLTGKPALVSCGWEQVCRRCIAGCAARVTACMRTSLWQEDMSCMANLVIQAYLVSASRQVHPLASPGLGFAD